MRWRYFAPFLVILGFLGLALFTANWWVKKALVAAGDSAVEAKVDIDRVRITYSPFSLSIEGIQITNPKFPMRNMVEIGQVYVGLNGRALLEKKVVIEGIKIEDISLNTPRKTSGEIKGLKPKPQSKLSKELEAALDSQLGQVTQAIPKLELPKPENLKITKAFDSAKKALADNQKKWEDTLKGKPFEADVNTLSQDLKTIQSASNIQINSIQDIAKIQKLIGSVQDSIDHVKKLQAQVDTQKNQLTQEFGKLNQSVTAIPDAGKQDLKDVMAPFSADRFKHINFGAAAFTKPLHEALVPVLSKVQKAMYYKKRFASPNPPRLRGRDPGENISFEREHEFPKFWLKLLEITGHGKQGEFISGRVTDVASDQRLIGKPMAAVLKGEHLLKQNLSFLAEFDQSLASNARRNHLQLSMKGLSLAPYFKPKKPQDFYMQRGNLGLNSDITVVSGILNSHTQIAVTDLSVVGPQSANPYDMSTIISEVLGQIHMLEVSLGLSGPFKHLHAEFQSNVDNAFSAALSASIQKRLQAEQDKVRAQIDQLIKEKQAEVDKELAKQKAVAEAWIKAQQAQVDALKKNLEDQKTKLENQANQYKKEAETKANQEINRVNQEAEKTKNKLQKQAEDAARNQLKQLFR